MNCAIYRQQALPSLADAARAAVRSVRKIVDRFEHLALHAEGAKERVDWARAGREWRQELAQAEARLAELEQELAALRAA